MKRVLLAALLCAPMTVFAEAAVQATSPQMQAAQVAGAKDPFTTGSAEAGAGKAAACGACHGPNGNSANPLWPKLAAQGSRFTFEQLQAFKAGARKDPVMQPQAAALSEQDMRDLAAHFAAQKPSPGIASPDSMKLAQSLYRAGNAQRGVPACAACHGPTGAGNAAAAYPRLSGQHATYAAARLRAYREFATLDLEDPKLGNLKIMAAVAARLSDAEIEALASYVNGLQ